MARAGGIYELSPEEIQDAFVKSRNILSTAKFSGEDDFYTLMEQYFHLALIVGDDTTAKLALQRITDRFGEKPSRVAVLHAEYLEQTEGIVKSHDYLRGRPATDYHAFKRKTVALKQKGDWQMFIEELQRYLKIVPSDSETWAELAEAFVTVGSYDEAVVALQQVTILAPQAYNIFSRIGEVLHIEASILSNIPNQVKALTESLDNFLRSVELCPIYVRGWAGVLVICEKLTNAPKTDKVKYNKLVSLAKSQLQSILDTNRAPAADLRAVKALLAQ